MPIIETYANPNTGNVERSEITHLGRVVKVRSYVAIRNFSDTLDYTDFRSCTVTEALVWLGREQTTISGLPESETNPVVQLAPADRFAWVDCTNIFTWRGLPHREPSVDYIALAIPELFQDLEAWTAIQEQNAKEAAEKQAKREAEEQARRLKEARDRPEVGKQMRVKSGSKVKPGTLGTIAYIHHSGRVLLKPDASWRDRNAQGDWIDPRHLEAR